MSEPADFSKPSAPRQATADASSSRLAALFFVLLVLWGGVTYLLAERLVSERSARAIDKELDAVSSAAATIRSNVGFTLAYLRSIPKVLARQSDVEDVLAGYGAGVRPSSLPLYEFRKRLGRSPGLSRLAQRLAGTLAGLDIDQIWVINAAGDCVASAGFPPGSSATGVNYADREYFRKARETGEGRQFAVGRTTAAPGIFYSASVFVDGRFLGIVAVKIDISRLSRMITHKTAFITDEHGVITVAADEKLRMKLVPGATVNRLSPEERLGRYHRQDFENLALEPVKVGKFALLRFPGYEFPMVGAVVDHPSEILKIHAFGDVPELFRVRREGAWVFFVLFLGGGLLIASAMAAIVHYRRSRVQGEENARVNAELVKLNRELSVQARFDALTGCMNRRCFMEELEGELKRAERFELPCSLAILDIDHFKSVNDRYGHAAGDAVLARFAATVGRCLRSVDTLARIGGEEFAVLMPQTLLSGAQEFAERIRVAVQHAEARHGEKTIRCTVSIGLAQWEGEGTVPFIARADKALYEAKSAGRNRVSAEPGGAQAN